MPLRRYLPLVLLTLLACGRQPASQQNAVSAAPPPPKVTTATFDPVYRAGKAIEGATAAGVSYVKFGELMQGFSTEIGIAKDHRLNEADRRLLAVYEKAFEHYQASAVLWKFKLDAGDAFKGEIPVEIDGKQLIPLETLTGTYKLTVEARTMSYTGKRYKAVPGDSAQRVWQTASATLQEATEIFYGRK